MIENGKGNTDKKPCGDESCGITDILAWRTTALERIESCGAYFADMTLAERVKLERLRRESRLELPQTLPGSFGQLVQTWVMLAVEADELERSTKARLAKKDQGQDGGDGDDSGGDDDGDDSGTDVDVTLPGLDLTLNPDLAVEIGRGANVSMGAWPILLVGGAVAAFAIYTSPMRKAMSMKGKKK